MSKPNFENYRNWNSWNNDAIIWDAYGYWLEHGSRPEWCTDTFLKDAKSFAMSLVEPKFELWFETCNNCENWNGKKAGAKWVIYDSANKLIIWENKVIGCASEKSAELYVKRDYPIHVRLVGGVIEALLTYKNKGIACLPDWNTNLIDSYGWKNGEKCRIPRVSEVK